jgi:co-chaperonin GroES (HSP10)
MEGLHFRGSLVGVVKATEIENKPNTAKFIAKPQTANDFGIVEYLGPEAEQTGLKKGDKVYHGKNVEPLMIEGQEVLVMKVDNIVAIKG